MEWQCTATAGMHLRGTGRTRRIGTCRTLETGTVRRPVSACSLSRTPSNFILSLKGWRLSYETPLPPPPPTQESLPPLTSFSRNSWDWASSRNCFNISWTCASQFFSFYLTILCSISAVPQSAYASPSFSYLCEDVGNYYSEVGDLKGEVLKKKLHSLISPHHSLSYKKVWDALKILDAADVDKPEASSGVVEIYTLRKVPKSLAGKPEGWNREHLWPRSYGLIDHVLLADLHNIRPSDVNVNLARGNKYYGECAFSSAKCLKPANKEAAIDTESDRHRWAPPRQVRGDIARALMYMAVCYGFHQPGGAPDLGLSDTPRMEKKEMGLLSTLLRWNMVDPPSREEKLRNDRICKFYQHNRNPFVDHPEYADMIWKQK